VSVYFPKPLGLYHPDREKDSCGVGFVANVKGSRSHEILLDAHEMLNSLSHRGACGCEPNTGDGAGILTALPHKFLSKVARTDIGADLPPVGQFATGLVFLPTIDSERDQCKSLVERVVSEQGQKIIGWRVVPTDAKGADLGATACASEPAIEQLFVASESGLSSEEFERKLYIIRKDAGNQLRQSSMEQAKLFYICSLSTKILVYKGQLMSEQLVPYYLDLSDTDYESHLAMVHSRFSTNTFPSWDRAQPNRFMCHNGEINTLRGNANWMHAREGVTKSHLYGANLNKIYPVVESDCSDSGNFDNVLEFLVMTGRSLPEAMMMMIPEAWQNNQNMESDKRAFYEYHSCLMEAWDGPASIAFTDGHYIGAVLDRNGLRPSRYYLTFDDRVIMASEVGVLKIDPENIRHKGRLQPGKMFLVDFQEGRVVEDEELKNELSRRRPYAKWLKNQVIELDALTFELDDFSTTKESLLSRLQAFGYTTETFQLMLLPLVLEKRDPLGSMGNDAALACLSDHSRLLYDYFKQLFAQVTNPAIDSIREELVMSLECYVGPEGNLLETTENHAHRLRIKQPILTNEELAALKQINNGGWKTKEIDITWSKKEGKQGMSRALDRICEEAEEAIETGFTLVVLSDRNADKDSVPISSLLACGAVHHHLIAKSKRTQIGIILESGEAREVHHHCLLIGYGADAVNPYLTFEALEYTRKEGFFAGEYTNKDIISAYQKGVAKGMLKVMAKMGISTLQSYKGAQIFEAVGLNDEIINRCFVGTPSRIQGVSLDAIAAESLKRHSVGYPELTNKVQTSLLNPGEFQWRAGGEKHAWIPEVISELQVAVRSKSEDSYQRYAQMINEDSRTRCTLRGLMQFKENLAHSSIALEKVEPATEIVRRFCTGAMSFGSISAETHETLAVAMNRIGGKSNTGEGGEDPERFLTLPNGDSKRSAIKQVASGRFGVTMRYLTNADELQIKISQGAKPGEGGELPGHKVDKNIAKIRYSTPGVGLISPPPHHDIYSIEDLKQLIHDLKNANRNARVSVKLVSEVGVGTIAAGVAKAFADHILISGQSGGTGASPLTSIKYAGLPWELGIAETHQTLVLNDLRSRVVLQTDGGLKTGRDVVIAALLGAEEFGFSTAPLVALGCIMMRKCHLNTCPVGIATQDPELRKQFVGQPEHVVNYLFLVAEEARQYMAKLGFSHMDDLIGRVDVLEANQAIKHWKASGLDLTPILTPAHKPHKRVQVRCVVSQDHGLDRALDNELIRLSRAAIDTGENVQIDMPIKNTNRTVGTMLSNEITKKWGAETLTDNTIRIKFSGSAGQSLAAWLVKGITIELEGDANDYVGKGLSGGRLIVYPPVTRGFVPEENIIVGNVVLYGATSGEAYFRGRSAERFCVRNSGVQAVVEGVGDHGCEYMTGGRVVVLGSTGRNFAAGMSGGIAYVWNPNEDFESNCNLELVELEQVEDKKEMLELKEIIQKHFEYTNSTVAQKILLDWNNAVSEFTKVMPMDYKRILQEEKRSSSLLDSRSKTKSSTG